MSQPLTTQVASIAACLPEQFISTGAFGAPGPDHSPRAAVVEREVGRGLQRDLVKPAAARIRRTPSMWNGSPECDAHASASSSGGRSRPGAHHAQRLERLVARARQHRLVDVARRTSRRLPSAASATTDP